MICERRFRARSAMRKVIRFCLRQTRRAKSATISSSSTPNGVNSAIRSLCSFSNSARLSPGRTAVAEYAPCLRAGGIRLTRVCIARPTVHTHASRLKVRANHNMPEKSGSVGCQSQFVASRFVYIPCLRQLRSGCREIGFVLQKTKNACACNFTVEKWKGLTARRSCVVVGKSAP